MATWSEIAATVITKHLKGAEPAILTNQVFPAMLYKRGRIRYNCAGTDFDWRVRFRRRKGAPINDTEEITLSRINQHKVASLPYKGFQISDMYSKGDVLANRAPEAITSLLSTSTESLIEDLKVDFGIQLLYNGDSAGNEDRITGYNSVSKHSGTAAINPLLADNNGSYAGINLARGAYGGSWSDPTKWPLIGTGDEHYYFWTPLILNYTSANWATNVWSTNCLEVLGYLTTAQLRFESKDEKIDVGILDLELFRQFKEALRLKERIMVSNPQSDVVQLGFKEAIDFDNVPFVPSTLAQPGIVSPNPIGFGVNFGTLALLSMQSQLFISEVVPLHPIKRIGAIVADFMGNLQVRRPRCQAKIEKIS